MQKTGLTEAGAVIVVLGILESASHFLLANPIIPAPWGGVVVAVLGLAVLLLRIMSKRAGA